MPPANKQAVLLKISRIARVVSLLIVNRRLENSISALCNNSKYFQPLIISAQ